ncbi:integrase [Lactobacillus colini]|uniref:Integrase n=1 Tax=Lactobacillus colini TaxID=1819254 RepID=A0ABS4MBB1_9LACO|nr:tyrosine-type recombinase/integrase [Lactobacillus colini]MBP2056967.1 integrase [Lactobacillus colini]
MASIKKRGEVWQARVTWYTSGKRNYKSKSGFKTKAEAKRWANKYEVQKDNHQITKLNPVFAEYFNEWAKTYRKIGKTTTSIQRYDQIEKYLKDYFGKQKISTITHRQYQKFINEYGSNKSKSTVQKNHGTIKACVEDAKIDNIITNNFTERTNLVWNAELTRKQDYLSENEAKKLEKNLLTKINPKFTSRYMILTALYTGMRLGEIMALKWSDINFKEKTIDITKSYDYINKKLKGPKNASSVRVIRVNDFLLTLLSDLQENKQPFVFANDKGSVPSPAGVNKVLRKHLKECDCYRKTFHFHSLRHTHASLLLFNGVQLYAISKRLGHSNMLVTAKIYSHMIDEFKAQEDNKIENVLDDFVH